MIVAAASTVALGFFPFHLAPAGLCLVVIIALSASEAALWILWDERYACVKASFTINHIGTVFGITLFLCVLIASLLPPTITAPATALLPLASGADVYKRQSFHRCCSGTGAWRRRNSSPGNPARR